MATGRTTFNFTRIFADGLDISGYTRSVGPLIWEYDEVDLTCPPGDGIKGYLPGQPRITPTAINTVLDNDVVGTGVFRSSLVTPGAAVTLMIPIGIRAAPALGDPVWAGIFQQLNYAAENDGGAVTVNIPFGVWDVASLNAYQSPWGQLLLPKTTLTSPTVNTSAGADSGTPATSLGGVMTYMLLSSNGTLTLKCQDATTNSDAFFADLTGATSGLIDASITPAYGLVALSATQAVKRYLRYQVVWGSATTAVAVVSMYKRTVLR